MNGDSWAPLPMRDVLNNNDNGGMRFGPTLGHGPQEIEVRLPGRFDISPDRTAALHGLPGVLDVEEL